MNTAVTIPWEAVVEGCPPSQQAKVLPLVVSKRLQRRAGSEPCVDAFADLVARHMHQPMAMFRCSPTSSLLELPLPEDDSVAILSSDGESRVVLQTRERPLIVPLTVDGSRDAFARRYVTRYARLDADAAAFVAVEGRPDGDDLHFLNPCKWGFTRLAGAWHWTGAGLFHTAETHPHRPSAVSQPRHLQLPPGSSGKRPDVFQCLPELNQARAICEEQVTAYSIPDLVQLPCYQVAVSLGRCRVIGIDPPSTDDFSLTPTAFHHAAEYLLEYVKGATKWIAEVDVDPYVERNVALNLLEMRTDFWLALVALDEAYAAAVYDGSPEAPAMSRRLTQVRRLINLFDGNLRKNLPLLRLAASTYLLDNWRRLLAPAHRDCPPWWLDGCIG